MTRQLFFAITLIATGMLVSSSAGAASADQCEERAANCRGGCADKTGGAGDLGGHQNKCLPPCDRRLIKCLERNQNRISRFSF
jgi:hypothetical protein